MIQETAMVELNGLHIFHGYCYPLYTAAKVLREKKVNCVCAHTHRYQVMTDNSFGRTLSVTVIPCLQDIQQAWWMRKKHGSWTPGVATATLWEAGVDDTGRPIYGHDVQAHLFHNGQLSMNGRIYR